MELLQRRCITRSADDLPGGPREVLAVRGTRLLGTREDSLGVQHVELLEVTR